MNLVLSLLLGCGPAADRRVEVAVDTTRVVARVDPRFLSFAVDSGQVAGTEFWNAEPVATGGEVEVAPYDFGRQALRARARPLAPAFLRIGGTDADHLFYDVSDPPPAEPPAPYHGVLTAEIWDGVGDFAQDLGLDLMFTVGAGAGPRDAEGAWVSDNARAFLSYALERGDPVEVWELTNEPNAFFLEHGFGLEPTQWADDLRTLAALRDELAPSARVAGPTVAYWPRAGAFLPFLEDAVEAAGPSLDVVSWHYYPQQSTRCPLQTVTAELETMLDPAALDELDVWADEPTAARDAWAPDAELWLGETGNAQCGGQPGVSDRFAGSFWWIDQLGKVARRGQAVVVRQTLSGSDYGLLDDDTLAPRPDWWLSVLHKRLVGTEVLDVESPDPMLRLYAHCARAAPGEAVVFGANLDADAALEVRVDGLGRWTAYTLEADGLDAGSVRLEGVELALEGDALPPLEGTRTRRWVLAPRSLGFAVASGAEACGR